MFDQRMFRPSSDQHYFQLQPDFLTFSTQNSHLIGKVVFRFKLMKGYQLIDEVKKQIGGHFTDNKFYFDKSQLSFYLPTYNPDKDIQFKLIILITTQTSNEKELGHFIINSGNYINKFKKEQTRLFSQNCEISEEKKLYFTLYMEKSRMELQKFMRQVREKEKIVDKESYSTEKKPCVGEERKRIIERKDEGKRVLPRKEQTKGNQNKKDMRNRKEEEKRQSEEISEEVEENKVKEVKKYQIEGKKQNQKINREKASKMIRKSQTISEGNLNYTEEQYNLLSLDDFQPSKNTTTQQNHRGKKKEPSVTMVKSKLKIKRTDSSMFNSSGGEQQKKKKEKKEKGEKEMMQKQKKDNPVLMIVFLVASLFVLYLVMSPSRKF